MKSKIILLSIVLLSSSMYGKSLFSNGEQKEVSIYIGSLKNLMISTQKTRGLTNSYLNGNTSDLLLLFENKKNMKKAISNMESSKMAEDQVINNRASKISDSLLRLNSKSLNMDKKEVFKKYTDQIESILILSQTVNKRGYNDLNDIGKKISSLMIDNLLPLTEYIGKTRGFGSGIAAKKSITKDDTMIIYANISEIEDLNRQINTIMNSLLENNGDEFPINTSVLLAKLNKSISKYMILTKEKLLKNPSSVNSTEYFENGSDIISLITKLYDNNNKVLLNDSKGYF